MYHKSHRISLPQTNSRQFEFCEHDEFSYLNNSHFSGSLNSWRGTNGDEEVQHCGSRVSYIFRLISGPKFCHINTHMTSIESPHDTSLTTRVRATVGCALYPNPIIIQPRHSSRVQLVLVTHCVWCCGIKLRLKIYRLFPYPIEDKKHWTGLMDIWFEPVSFFYGTTNYSDTIIKDLFIGHCGVYSGT